MTTIPLADLQVLEHLEFDVECSIKSCKAKATHSLEHPPSKAHLICEHHTLDIIAQLKQSYPLETFLCALCNYAGIRALHIHIFLL